MRFFHWQVTRGYTPDEKSTASGGKTVDVFPGLWPLENPLLRRVDLRVLGTSGCDTPPVSRVLGTSTWSLLRLTFSVRAHGDLPSRAGTLRIIGALYVSFLVGYMSQGSASQFPVLRELPPKSRGSPSRVLGVGFSGY